MVGTRLGDRVLVIGGGDGRLVAAVGAPTGLTGRVTAVEPDAAVANQVEVAATVPGSWSRWRRRASIACRSRTPPSTSPSSRCRQRSSRSAAALADTWRVVRTGGRAMVVAAAGVPESARVIAALGQAGFRAARLLGEREGLAFYESSRPANRNPG